ncbi:3-oxoacyl-[acyl-carrier protein] reductase [Haloferula luteola]|uniref:3-oxoacyl-[acyl-carrier protein] reductase n=1 Tax=Haloferula luteola TaxID=595692 RepID=A0A840V448_9BACT|nr:glucose 1-dehydrogenase [Haloferula luteola]MBB5352762.1 3-oxoacyl-[acyl-carrier protein] reductase [Haloferula luteola]
MSAKNEKLTGKVAVVTGASKGIGAGIAKDLAKAGASVVVNYASSREGADKVVEEILAAGGAAKAVQADVSKAADIERLFAEAVAAFGQVDILVNNAGIYEWAALEEITEESFHRQFGLNVLGLLLTTREGVKHFPESGGSVINISSIAGSTALPGCSVYGATKASVDLITKVLAKELGPRGIRVNEIAPGMVETEGAAEFVKSDFGAQVVAQTPLGRIGTPADIAAAAVFLASEDASWMSGEAIYLSGGYR